MTDDSADLAGFISDAKGSMLCGGGSPGDMATMGEVVVPSEGDDGVAEMSAAGCRALSRASFKEKS
jgi:hypothetical protein